MSNDTQNITINISAECDIDPADLEGLEALARQICIQSNATSAFVDINVVDDDAIVKIHAQFLHSSAVTDVISFDLSDDSENEKYYQVIVNHDEALRQARQRGHTVRAELALYVTHGLLHNFGHDDTTEDQARQMHIAEDKFLTQAGYGTVYDSDRTE